MDDNSYDEDGCPCVGCGESDPWECACCVLWHDWIGDDDFDPWDI